MTLSLLIQLKAMMLSLRFVESAASIQFIELMTGMRMARILQIAKGLEVNVSAHEVHRLTTLVSWWEEGYQ